MTDYGNESEMKKHNVYDKITKDGACVGMNSRGDLNLPDCFDQLLYICENVKMSCEHYESQYNGPIRSKISNPTDFW